MRFYHFIHEEKYKVFPEKYNEVIDWTCIDDWDKKRLSIDERLRCEYKLALSKLSPIQREKFVKTAPIGFRKVFTRDTIYFEIVTKNKLSIKIEKVDEVLKNNATQVIRRLT